MLDSISFLRPLIRLLSEMVTSHRFVKLSLLALVIVIAGQGCGSPDETAQNETELEYLAKLDDANRQGVRFQSELAKIRREQAGLNREHPSWQKLEDKSRELSEQIAKMVETKRDCLEQLSELDPENQDYLFDLALSYPDDNPEKLAILMKLAPEDEAGYFKAHRVLAQYFFVRARNAQTENEKASFQDKALIQANHCLTLMPNEKVAKAIKAGVLQAQNRIDAAYRLYEELFEGEVEYYRPLIELNNQRGTPEKNSSIVDSAYPRLKAKLEKNENDDTRVWVVGWTDIVRCLMVKEAYETAIQDLESEYSRQILTGRHERKNWLNAAMGEIYAEWAGEQVEFATMDEESQKLALARLKKAYKKNQKSPTTLTKLAWFVNSDSKLAEQARQIYDPSNDPEAPPSVISDVGAKALKDKDYQKAIEFFERAVAQAPNSPLLLNNLAFALLSSEENPDAERALGLVNKAIQLLGTGQGSQVFRSSLLHTRGTAFMRLSRMEEAAASFEAVLEDRPNDQETIKLLIQCYEGRNENQADVYRARLKELESATNGLETN